MTASTIDLPTVSTPDATSRNPFNDSNVQIQNIQNDIKKLDQRQKANKQNDTILTGKHPKISK